MLGVLLALTLAGPPVLEPDCERVRCPRVREVRPDGARGYAFFEFAPSSGAGMGAACACTTPTGAKGEAMTFTRASSGTCLKGNVSSGIANGDMVTCSTNQPRVMPGGDGSGGLGQLVEGSRTNDALRSQELENAAWGATNLGCAAITVTANQAVAPDGTTTAERFQIPACTSTQYSLQYQDVANATRSHSVFLKGNGGSGVLHLATEDAACTTCSYNPTTWTRCVLENRANTTRLYIGIDPADCGGGDQVAKDVFVSGAQTEVGAFASSYIATTSAAVTRAAELPKFTVSWPAPGVGWSMAATYITPPSIPTDPFAFEVTISSNDRYDLHVPNGTQMQSLVVVGGAVKSQIVSAAAGALANATIRAVGFYDGTNQNACVTVAGTTTCAAGAQSYTPFAPTTAVIGAFLTGGDEAWGVVKKLCYDPNPTRCR